MIQEQYLKGKTYGKINKWKNVIVEVNDKTITIKIQKENKLYRFNIVETIITTVENTKTQYSLIDKDCNKLVLKAYDQNKRKIWIDFYLKQKQNCQQRNLAEETQAILNQNSIAPLQLKNLLSWLVPIRNIEAIEYTMGTVMLSIAKLKEQIDDLQSLKKYSNEEKLKQLDKIQQDIQKGVLKGIQQIKQETGALREVHKSLGNDLQQQIEEEDDYQRPTSEPESSRLQEHSANIDFHSFILNNSINNILQRSILLDNSLKNKTKIKPNKNIKKSKEILDYIQRQIVFQKYPIDSWNIVKRTTLPALRDPNQKINTWQIIKDCVGKDLTRISMPVYFNEPLSLLQKILVFLEYKELIHQANQETCKSKQCALILSAFVIIYGIFIGTTKKPFNPLLGETFEYFNPEFSTRAIVEQVSHHPPICAFYTENDDFVYTGWLQIRIMLGLSGVKVLMDSKGILTLKSTNDQFEIIRPYSSVHNVFIGEMFIWNEGKAICKSLTTGHYCEMFLHPLGSFQKKDYKISGFVKNESGQKEYCIKGNWNKEILMKKEGEEEFQKIVELKPHIDKYESQFYFSQFLVELNSLTQDMLKELPCTDSWLRPDLRAYEYGDVELAIQEKKRLEENQRIREKERQRANQEYQPQWFVFKIQNGEIIQCQYNHKYWESKNDEQLKDTNRYIY